MSSALTVIGSRLPMKAAGAGVAVVIALCTGAGPVLAQQAAPSGRAVQQACAADYRSLCAGVKPGGGRIMACFRQNAAKLSPGCQQALSAARSAHRPPASGS